MLIALIPSSFVMKYFLSRSDYRLIFFLIEFLNSLLRLRFSTSTDVGLILNLPTFRFIIFDISHSDCTIVFFFPVRFPMTVE